MKRRNTDGNMVRYVLMVASTGHAERMAPRKRLEDLQAQ